MIYIAFLVLLGLPIMSAELAVGRGSQRSIASSFDVLEKKGQKWHMMKYLGICGNYLLMMFYTVISGWMVIYFVKYLTGSIMSASGVEGLSAVFGNMVSNPGLMVVSAFAVILICFGICSMGLQKGVEGITKWMMVALLALMIGLAVYSVHLPNAAEGLRFYLVPSLKRLEEAGVSTVISAAMGQSFFTLSLGIGAIAIFGSYIGKERRLLGESVTIVCLDTFVAIMSGMIIFPACFTYNQGVTADAGSVGAGFLFTTLSSIFNGMPGGRVIGMLFFLFMIFASFSTVIAVFENIMSFWLELTKLNRRTIALINAALLMVLPPALRAESECVEQRKDFWPRHYGLGGFCRFQPAIAHRQSVLRAFLCYPVRLGMGSVLCRGQSGRPGRSAATLDPSLHDVCAAADHTGGAGHVRFRLKTPHGQHRLTNKTRTAQQKSVSPVPAGQVPGWGFCAY